jgi:hypothetical protein
MLFDTTITTWIAAVRLGLWHLSKRIIDLAPNLGCSLKKWGKVAFCKSISSINQTMLFQNKKGEKALLLSARIICLSLWNQYRFPQNLGATTA